MMNKAEKNKFMKSETIIPPDGGWGWMIVVAAGFSNLSTFPVIQQFGLLFRDTLNNLGISGSQVTTIININSAATACIGLANGPVFKTFSFRKVAFVGSTLVFFSLLLTTFANNFITYLISFSILYGAGVGIAQSANALALNTYFKNKRRVATGLSWTTTGLGPIIMPHVITLLFPFVGQHGTVLLLSGFSLHAVACSLLLQPVEWHSKSKPYNQNEHKEPLKNLVNEKINNDKYNRINRFKNKSISVFSSQYLYNEDDPVNAGYEIIDPGTPMLSKRNDGYFGTSKRSLNRLTSIDGSLRNSRSNLPSQRPSYTNLNEIKSKKSSMVNLNESKKYSYNNQPLHSTENNKNKRRSSITMTHQIPEVEIEDCPTLKAPHDLREDEKLAVTNIDAEKMKFIADEASKQLTKSIKSFDDRRYITNNRSSLSLKQMNDYGDDQYIRNNHSVQSLKNRIRKTSNNFNYENEVLKLASEKLEAYLHEKIDGDFRDNLDGKYEETFYENVETKLTLWQKIELFFDLDLLKDHTYVNLMIGITIANFNELNFSLLTPFILGDFGMSKYQVATFMSLLAGVDIGVRFCIPFVAGRIGWENNTFFLFGVLCMATGRIVLAHCQLFEVTLLVAVIIGFGKGLRTVFIALVIPTHVPLDKLPGATGIHLLTSGLFFLFMGPAVGWIKDSTNNTITLHCLNIFTYITAISWGLMKYYKTKKIKKKTIS